MTTAANTKATKASHGGAAPPEPEQLPCPRCDSTNTKFCYYNNYNFSQPRHFCKSCRRYWTHGGTLRDIPVGGGSRKNTKRSRTRTSAANHGGAVGFPSFRQDFRHFPAGASQHFVPIAAEHGGAVPFVSDGKMCGSFTSLLNGGGGNGLLSLGGFELGLGSGLDDMGFGLGTGFWPITGVVEGGPTSGYSNSSLAVNTWQLENVETGFVGSGDCFALPDLAISTHGSLLK